MKNDDRFKYLVGGYYGIKSMDDYQSKLYVLKDVEKYIEDYCNSGEEKYDYKSIAEEIYANTSLKEKLQDSLILLNDMKGPIELVIMIKQKIKEIKYNEDHQRWTFLFDENLYIYGSIESTKRGKYSMLRLVLDELLKKNDIESTELENIKKRLEEIRNSVSEYNLYETAEKNYQLSQSFLKQISIISGCLLLAAILIGLIGFLTSYLSLAGIFLLFLSCGIPTAILEFSAISSHLKRMIAFNKIKKKIDSDNFKQYEINKLQEEKGNLEERKENLESDKSYDEEMIKSIKEYLGLYDEVKEKYPDIFAEYQEFVDSIESIHKKNENHAYKLN